MPPHTQAHVKYPHQGALDQCPLSVCWQISVSQDDVQLRKHPQEDANPRTAERPQSPAPAALPGGTCRCQKPWLAATRIHFTSLRSCP